MLGYVRPYRLALLAGGLLSLVTGATGLALPLVAKDLVDDLGHGRSVAPALLLMTALVVANAGIGAVGGYVLRRTAESVVLTAGASWCPGYSGCASPRWTAPSRAISWRG